jgi:pullulanase
MLRSKSADEDSYDYGDWFNALDFSYESNNWGVGLPNADKNVNEWDALIPLLTDPALVPAKADILKAVAHFRELLQIRQSSPLFRLRTADDIQQRVRFLNAEARANQIPGVIAMMVADFVGADLDPEREMVLAIVNVTPDAITFSHEELIGADLDLHPVLQNSADALVKEAVFDINTGSLTVPARTAVVYQEEQSGTGPSPTPTPDPTSPPGVIPEPGTLVLLVLGLLGMVGIYAHQRNSKK